MRPDHYPGLDLLADVFEGTEDAPNPVPVVDAGGSTVKLWANPADPRWSIRMDRRPNGDVACVHWCVPAVETA
jgi:hypothetical protein